jgi:hypothetical protein
VGLDEEEVEVRDVADGLPGLAVVADDVGRGDPTFTFQAATPTCRKSSAAARAVIASLVGGAASPAGADRGRTTSCSGGTTGPG